MLVSRFRIINKCEDTIKGVMTKSLGRKPVNGGRPAILRRFRETRSIRGFERPKNILLRDVNW